MRYSKDIRILYNFNHILLVIYFLLISNGLFAPLVYNYDRTLVDDSGFFKIIKYAPVVLIIILNTPKHRAFNYFDKFLFFFAFFYIISSVWSPAFLDTFTDGIQFLVFVYFCYFITTLPNIDMLFALRAFLFITLFFSFYLYLFVPDMGAMSGVFKGYARGIFLHKNGLGTALVLLLPILLVNKMHKYNLILLFFSLLLLYLSNSSTSIVAAILIFLISYFIGKLDKQRLIFFVSIVVAILIYVYFNFSSFILKVLGKGADLNGRIQLWNDILTAIAKRPVFGWGYWGFWKSSIKESTFSELAWITGKSHNAYLEVLLSGGYFLLSVFILFLIITFLKLTRYEDTTKRSIALLTFFAMLVLSVAEISILEHNSIFLFVLYSYANWEKEPTKNEV